jgi:hypothetical protein
MLSSRPVKCSPDALQASLIPRRSSPPPAAHLPASPLSTSTNALPTSYLGTLSTPSSALPHQPDPAPLTFPSSHCPLLVPSKSNTRQQCAEARLHVEWCCAAAQSPRRRYGVAERRRRGNPSELWLPIRRSPSSCRPGCPDACHAVRRSVRVRCPPCGRTSVQLVGWTSGVRASGVHASGVHAPGVHTTGVIRVSGRTRVRCPRPLQPRWIRNTSVRRDRPRLVHRVRRVAVVGERLGRRCPNRAWRAKMVERWPCVARTRVDARLGAASQASRLRRRARRLADQGSRSRARCRSVGGGAGEEQVLPSPRRCVLGGLPACWPTMGWTGRW